LDRLDVPLPRAAALSEASISASFRPNTAATSFSSNTFSLTGAGVFSAASCPKADSNSLGPPAQHKEKLRLTVEPSSNPIERRRNMLAHAGAIRAAGQLDFPGGRKQAIAFATHSIHDALYGVTNNLTALLDPNALHQSGARKVRRRTSLSAMSRLATLAK
jgi:hypothetical protein